MAEHTTIGLQLQLNGKEEVKKSLDEIFKYAKQNKDLDINIDSNALKTLDKLNEAIATLSKSIEKMGKVKIGMSVDNNTSKEIEAQQKALKELNKTSEEISKKTLVSTVDSQGNEQQLKYIKEIKNAYGDVLKVSKDLQSGLTTKTHSVNYEKQQKEIDKLVAKLAQYKETVKNIQSTDLFNKGVFDGNSKMKGFDEKILSIDFSDIEKAKKQIESLGKSVSQLEANGRRMNTLQKSLNSIRGKFNELKGDKDVFSTLDTTKVTNYQNAIKDLSNIMKRVKANSGTVTDLQINDTLENVSQKIKILEKDFNSNLGVDKFINKIKSAFDSLDKNGLSTDFISGLQKQINSLDVSTPRKQLEQLYNTISKTSANGGVKGNANQVEKVQKQINEIKTSLTSLRGKYGVKLVDEKSAGELDKVNKELKELETLKQRLGNGEVIKGSEISSACNKAKDSMKGLTNATKNNSNAMKMAQQDAMSFGEALSRTLSRFGMYASVAMVTQKVFSSMRDGIKDIIALEDSMISLQRVCDEITDKSLTDFQNKFVATSRELATNSADYIDSVTSFKKLGYNLDEAETLATQTTKFNLAGDINNMEEATTDVVSVLKGFKLEATDVNRVIDGINTTSNKYAVTSQDLANILQKSASSLSVFGNDLEESISLGTVANEILQDSDKVGRSLKTLSARIGQVQKGVPRFRKELLDLAGVDLLDMNGQLKSTYDIMNELGSKWKGLDSLTKSQIGNDLFGKDNITTGYAILENYEKLAEVKNSLADSSGSVEDEFGRYLDSTSAKLEQLKTSVLQLWTGFIDSDMTKGVVDGLTSFVDGIGFAFDKLGAFPTITTAVVGGMTVLNDKFRENAKTVLSCVSPINSMFTGLDNLKKKYVDKTQAIKDSIKVTLEQKEKEQGLGNSTANLNKQLVAQKTALAGAKTATIGLQMATIALESAMTMGLSFVISELITKLTEFMDFAGKTEDALDALGEANDSLDKTNQADALVNKWKELSESMKSGELTTEQMTQKKSELNEVQKQLAQTVEGSATAYDKEGDKIATNIGLVEKQIESQRKLAKVKAEKSYNDAIENLGMDVGMDAMSKFDFTPSGIGKKIGFLTGKNNFMEEYKRIKEELDSTGGIADEDDLETFEKITEGITKANEAMKSFKNAGGDISQKSMFDLETGEIIKATEWMEKYADETEKVGEVSKETANQIMEMYESGMSLEEIASSLGMELEDVSSIIGDVGDSASDTKNKIEEMADAFNGVTNNIGLVKSAMEEYSETGGLTEGTISKILNSGDVELIRTLLTDSGDYIERANGLLDVYKEKQKNALQDAVNFANTEQQKAQASVNSANVQAQAQAGVTDQNAQNYQIDANNKAQAEDSKLNSVTKALNGGLTAGASAVGKHAELYNADIKNNGSAVNSKAKTQQSYLNALNQSTASTMNKMGDAYNEDVKNFQRALSQKIADLLKVADKGGMEGAGALLGAGSLIGQSVAIGGYNKVDIGASSIEVATPSAVGISSGSSSKGSSKTEKDYSVENLNLEDYIDRHYKLENKIRDVKHQQELLSKEIENSYGKRKLDLQNEYIQKLREEENLTNQLINSKRNELWDKRVALDRFGINFDVAGNITNMNEIYTKLINASNAINDTTEAGANQEREAQERIKSLKDIISSYKTLQGEIQDLESEYKELSSTIKEVYKEISSSYADLESDLDSIIKDKVDEMFGSQTDALDKLKDKVNKQWEDDEWEDTKAEKEQDIIDLKSQLEDAMRVGNTTQIKNLKKQLEDAQKEYSDLIKENEKENILNKIDEEKEKIENTKEEMLTAENLSSMIQEAIQNGWVNIGGQVYETQKLMEEYTKSSVEGYQSQKIALDEYIRSLETCMSYADQLNGVNSHIGYVNSVNYSAERSRDIANALAGNNSVSSRTIQFNSPLMNIDSLSNDVDVDAMVDKAYTKVLQAINSRV